MIFGKHINKYYIKYLPLLIIGILALISVDWVQLYLPEELGKLVNLFNNANRGSEIDHNILLRLLLNILIIGVVMFIGRLLWRITLLTMSKKIEMMIRHDMYIKAEALAIDYYHTNKIGSVMSWFTTDLETIEDYLAWGTMMMVDALFLGVFTLFKMFSNYWGLTLIVMIPIILIAVWGALVERFMGMKWEQRQKSFDRLYDFTQEGFTGIRVIKAFVKEFQQISEFRKLAKRDKDVNVSFYRISVLFDVIVSLVITIAFVLIMGFGGFLVYKTIVGSPIKILSYEVSMDAGGLITFIGYTDTLIWPMMALGQVVTMYSRCKASYKRVAAFLDAEEAVQNKEDAIKLENVKGEITFSNFSFKYPSSNNTVLKNISLSIQSGELVGVVGKVGCGKSTLFNSLLRLYNVDNNSIFVDGVDIMDLDIASLRKNIAFVPQETFLFQDKIKNNIAYIDEDLPLEKIKDAAQFADVDSNIEEFSEKYETISGERGQTLSGGQKQRIAIARAYILDAPIMVLDDSVSAVDIKTEETILKNIKDKRKGKTTIIIASRISTVLNADKIIVLNNGELEAFDTPKNLLKTCDSFIRMVKLQELEMEEVK
ncbi:MAG: ABC transporter ATP-binding protein [Bacilli bacterium]